MVSRRLLLGRQLAAELVLQSRVICAPIEVAAGCGVTRQTAHLWLSPERSGVALSHVLAGPPAWSRWMLQRALLLVDGIPPRSTRSPQAVVARLLADVAQLATVLEDGDLDEKNEEELEELRKTAAAAREKAAQLEAQILAAQARKRQRAGRS